jgi:ferric-dicitrate binding protein FerR (iron transport regulator)
MSAVLTSPDASQFRSFANGSEDGLASIYRAQYDSLIALSREKLGDDLSMHAPRIAQQAMLDAWNSRSRFENPDGLSAYLAQAVEECVAVQKRKHAALHRRGGAPPRKTGPAQTADEAVTALMAALHAPPPTHDELIAEAKAQKKHHAAAHVQKVAKPRNWKGPLALIGSLVVVAALFLWYMDSRSEDIAIDKALSASDARSVSTSRGQRGPVTLNDESKANLGGDTRLKMPRDFGGTMRTVQLTGVAHFDVAPGKPLPFRVRAGNAVVTATGTSFGVRAYEGDSVVLVSVTDGTVEVTIRDSDAKQTVNAGNAVRIVGDSILPLDAEARDIAMAWTRDTLVLVNMSVNKVMTELGRWFDLAPKLADPSLGDRTVSLRIPLRSSGDALKAMADSARLQIGFDKDEKVVLSDAPPAPAKKKK